MDQIPFIKTLLYTEWISWVIHFAMFFILARWSGIKWTWAILLVFAIEIWETADWALQDPLRWWKKPDTYIDILTGCLAIWLAVWLKKRKT
ncbi:MAG TPA: hypothetical protein PLP19_17090 [bacterium]|nr:hypothetical protein [bacterium]HPN45211.1 hypothetical protein [bacterium]